MNGRWLVVGLGNPGRKYVQTRHNIGWFVLDELARRHELDFSRSAQGARLADGRIGGRQVLLAKPQGFMNRSGLPVRNLLRYWRIEPGRLLIVLDDLDQPAGTLRLRAAGGAGGQRGLEDIIAQLGTREFSRLRLGIGRPPGRMDPVAWVLKPLKGDDAIRADEMVGRAADAVETWLQAGIEVAMTRHNGDGSQARTGSARETPAEQLERWRRAWELNGSDPVPPEKISRLVQHMGQAREAAQWLLRAAALRDARGEAERSLLLQERALNLDPGLLESQRELAARWLARGNTRKAVRRYWLSAEWLAQQGRREESLAMLGEVLKLNASHNQALALRLQLQAKSCQDKTTQTSER